MSIEFIQNKENQYNIHSEKNGSEKAFQSPVLGSGLSSSLNRLIELSELAEAWAKGEIDKDIPIDEYSTLEDVQNQMAEKKKAEEDKEVDPGKEIDPEKEDSSINDENFKQMSEDTIAYQEASNEYKNAQDKINDLQALVDDSQKIENLMWALTHEDEINAWRSELETLRNGLPAIEEKFKAAEEKFLSDQEKFGDSFNVFEQYAELRDTKAEIEALEDKIDELEHQFDATKANPYTETNPEYAQLYDTIYSDLINQMYAVSRKDITEAMTDAFSENEALLEKLEVLESRIQKEIKNGTDGYEDFAKVNQYLEAQNREKYLENKLAHCEKELKTLEREKEKASIFNSGSTLDFFGGGSSLTGQISYEVLNTEYEFKQAEITKIKEELEEAKKQTEFLKGQLENIE